MNILGNKNSIIENLLDIDNIVELYIYYYKTALSINYIGNVKFQKNNTILTQEFKGNSISDVYLQIFNFCNSLWKRINIK